MVEVGDTINGKYRLLHLIGEGGMGCVYQAHHELLGTKVALKFLHPEIADQEVLQQRFLQEARVSAAISNPHIVRVLDVDSFSEGAFLVMELLTGEPLSYLLERVRRLPLSVALEHMFQTLDGVIAAHAIGIVHRDLKPDNLFVVPDGAGTNIKILDFGIAKLRQSSEYKMMLTRPGAVMGTPEYMAPEQAYSADLADSRSDVFSLGVVLFEMLSGKRPAEGETPQVIAEKVLTGNVLRLGALCPALPSGLINVVHTAMSADPEHRWKDAAALRDALLPFVPKPATVESAAGVGAVGSAVAFSGLSKTPRLDGVKLASRDDVPATRIEPNQPAAKTEAGAPAVYLSPPPVRTVVTAHASRPREPEARPRTQNMPQRRVPTAAAVSRRGVSRLAVAIAALGATALGATLGIQAYYSYDALPPEPPRPVRRVQAVAPVPAPVALPQVQLEPEDDSVVSPPVIRPRSERVTPRVPGVNPAVPAVAAPRASLPVPELARTFEPVVIPIPPIQLPALPSNFTLPPGLPAGIPGFFGLPVAPTGP